MGWGGGPDRQSVSLHLSSNYSLRLNQAFLFQIDLVVGHTKKSGPNRANGSVPVGLTTSDL